MSSLLISCGLHHRNFISIGSIRHILKLRERSRTAPSTTQRSHQQRPAQAEQVRETSVHRIISSQETVPSPDDEDLAGTEARATVVSSGVAFLQRQSNASRVSPIRSSRPLADKETPRVNKRKRPRSVDSDESEESAFQTDTRQIASISRRAKKPRLERVSQNSTVSSPRRGPLARPQVNHPAASHPPSSRLSSVQPRGSREPERKLRIFWTKEEDRQLIRLVRKYGPHWARIEYMDAEEEAPKLKARNQISIKDRARQLKFNYLKFVLHPHTVRQF